MRNMVSSRNYSPKDSTPIEEVLLTLGGEVIGKRGVAKTRTKTSYDVSITLGEKSERICVTFRNGHEKDFGEYISFIRFEDYLYLVTPSTQNIPKCKVTRQVRKNGETHGYVIPHKDMTELLSAFTGDYELQYDKKTGAHYIELSKEE